MKKIKSYIAAALVGIAAFSFMGCKMIERTPESIKNTVLATVDGEKITRGDLDDSMAYVLSQLESQYGKDFENDADLKDQLLEYRKQQLENLVQTKILYKKAEEWGLVPTDEELQKEVDDRISMIKQSIGTEEQFLSYIQYYYGVADEEGFRKILADNVVVGKAVDKMNEEIAVTDEEIETYYNENKGEYSSGGSADVYNILLSKDKYTEEDAKEVRDKIVSGEVTYEDMAAKYNEDSTKDNGGSLGNISFDNSGLVTEVDKAIKTMSEGEISEPVESESYGWHILKVENVVPGTVKALDEVRDEIKETLTTNKQNELYDEKIEEFKKDMNVKTYEKRL